MYCYIESEKGVYTVGHYDPQGKFVPECDFSQPQMQVCPACTLPKHMSPRQLAANRVAQLNGTATPSLHLHSL